MEDIQSLRESKQELEKGLSAWQKAKEELEDFFLGLDYMATQDKVVMIKENQKLIKKMEEQSAFEIEEIEQSINFYEV